MAETTRNLGLPLIAAAQAQKHVTHNEALTALDALVQLACLDKDLPAPPASPAEGDRYLVTAASPGGAWAGLSGQVVRFADGVWTGTVPRPGFLAYLLDEADLYVFTGSAWASFRSTLTALQNLTRLGVGTAADASNRFAVKADAALLSWDDVTPGSGHMRVSLNKQAAAREAGFVFQTGYSTRALFGTLGSDDVTLKMSPDGTSFATALTVSTTAGVDLRTGETTLAAAATVDLGAVASLGVLITGTTTITGFGTVGRCLRLIRFAGALTLTHNATSLALPGAANLLTAAGDTAIATSDASGNWRVRHYARADGTPLALPASTQRASFRNRVRNGAFAINQRGVSGTVTLAAGAYGHDGWKGGASGATYTFSSGTLTITANTLQQVIEGGLYLPEGGLYTLSWTGTAQARVNGSGYATSPLAVTGLPAGINATVEFGTGTVSLVQFEPGTVATAFEFRDDELRRCQRYAVALTEAQNMGGVAGSGSYVLARFTLPVEMRADPAVSVAVSGSWIVSDDYAGDATANPVAIGASGLRRRGGRVQLTGFSGLTAGRWYGSSNGFGTAVLIASAEL